ncbi:MAG: DUF2062 domain-containing protein [Geminicoccaceae bacterium]
MKFRILRPILRIWRDKGYRPGTIGVSLASGMVIGFSPTVGLQMIICVITGFLWNRISNLRLNIPAMLVGSMVVNPITMGPTYYLYYKTGCLAVTCNVDMSADRFANLSSIGDLGSTILIAVLIGSIPFMIAGVPIGLFLGRKFEQFLEARRSKRGRGRGKIGLAAANKS